MRPSNGVHGITPVELEVSAQLLLQCRLDSLQNIIENTKASWVLLVITLALVHTSADKASIPSIHVATDDVGLRVVANHVDVLWQAFLVVNGFHPRGEDFVSVLIGSEFRLAVDDTLELNAGDSLVNCLESDAECALGHTGNGVLGRAEKIALGKVDWDAVSNGVLCFGAEDTVFRLKQVHNDLQVGGVVARVGEDKDGVDLDFAEVPWCGSGSLLGSEELL